jgi:membrane-associated phospholipid phosphatase
MRNLQYLLIPHPALWSVAIFVFLANGLWLILSDRLSVDPSFVIRSGAAVLAATALITVRIWRQSTFDKKLHRLWALALVGTLGMLFSINFGVLNHLLMSIPFPLADSWLQHVDTYLPVSWLAYAKTMTADAWARQALFYAYQLISAYGLYVFIVYCVLAGKRLDLLELSYLLIATTIVCMLIASVFPAKAAFALLADDELRQRLPSGSGVYHISQLMSLREAAQVHLKLEQLQGLSTFPSFHTVLGLLIVWAGRFNPFIFLASAFAGTMVVASTPIYGGHYFIDLIAGLIVMILAVAVWRFWLKHPAAKWVEQTDELWRTKP